MFKLILKNCFFSANKYGILFLFQKLFLINMLNFFVDKHLNFGI